MRVIISLLRGVNIGGHHRIKMDALGALYESLGLQGVQTYLQSGNVIFRTEALDVAWLPQRIEDGIERSFGFRPAIRVRKPGRKSAGSRLIPRNCGSTAASFTSISQTGMARSKLSVAVLEKTLGMPGTGRNWNTVRKLLELAERLEARQ